MNTFGEFLYTLRKEKGLTQSELAEMLGVTNKAVSKWETGEAMPETAQLLPIARIFGVTVDELLDGKRAQSDGVTPPDAKEILREEINRHLFTRGKDGERNKTVAEIVGGAVCASLFFASTAAYLLLGAIWELWTPYWIIIPVGALSCGIIGIIFDLCNGKKRSEKLARGENPYTGAVCGLIILSCIITYLCLGAFLNLWHPCWIIVIGGALICGITGAVGEVFTRLKKKDK